MSKKSFMRLLAMPRSTIACSFSATTLATLEQSVVYVTSANIEAILVENDYNSSAWDLANLYLGSLGAELLGADAPRIVGLSESMTCYVSPAHFAEDDPFADFIVHEAAHIFHNCKRRTIGLREKCSKEWLLDIEYRKRETFAYSCEAYARVTARARTAAERRALAIEYGTAVGIPDEHVDPAEVASIVTEAASARNGWKVILRRCAPPSKPRTAPKQMRESVTTNTGTEPTLVVGTNYRGHAPTRRIENINIYK